MSFADNDADNVFGRVRAKSISTEDGDWKEYVPTISGGTIASSATVNRAMYSVIGKTMYLQYTYNQPNNTGAAAGSGNYLISLPTGYTAFLSALGENVVGSARIEQGVGVFHTGSVLQDTSTQVTIVVGDQTNAPNYWGSSFLPLNTSGVTGVSFSATIRLV